MAINLGSAYGKVSIDASGVKSGVGVATNSLMQLSSIGLKVGATLQKIGAAMTIAVSVPLILIGKSAIQAASDLNEAKDNVRLVFGDMSDAVLKWSETSAKALGQSKQQALDGAAAFGLLFTQMGVGPAKAAQMSEKLVELATDIAEFNHTDVATVFGQLQSGLVGRGIELKKFGMDLTDATVKAKATAMGLADANGELTEGALIQARYALIMEQTAIAQGYFASKTGDLSKNVTVMKAQLQDSLAMLGERMIPIVLKVVDVVNRLLDAFQKLPVPVQDGILVMGGLLILAGPVIGFIGTVISLISSIVGVIGLLSSAGISLAAVVGVLGTIATVLATVVFPILLIIATLGFLYIAFKTNMGGIRTTVEQLWFIIKYRFSEGWKSIVETSQNGAASVGATMQSTGSGIQAIWQSVISWLRGAWQSAMDFLARMAAWGRNAIFSVFRVDWAGLGRSIIQGIINGFNSALSSLVASVKQGAQAVQNAWDNVFNSHSPSREMFKRGLWASQGFVLGMRAGLDPREIAKLAARPMQSMSSTQQQYITLQLGGGLTLQQASAMIASSEDRILQAMYQALSG